MELGEKLKQARLEAGLSQRQLCGEEITRNMLSQIENGSARPSMATLRYLAARLGKTVSWFLEEDAVTSPNLAVMDRARAAYRAGDFRAAEAALAEYREPDPIFDMERQLLCCLTALDGAEAAEKEGKPLYAVQLLEQLGSIGEGYCAPVLERRRLLLLGKLQPRERQQVCRALPGLDEELRLRAKDAQDRGDFERSGQLLDAVEDKENPEWKLLRGQICLALGQYEPAAQCGHSAEQAYPKECAALLEQCYREMGNFERAYFYACRQREEAHRGKTE